MQNNKKRDFNKHTTSKRSPKYDDELNQNKYSNYLYLEKYIIYSLLKKNLKVQI